MLHSNAKKHALKADKAVSAQKRSFFKKSLNKAEGVGTNKPAASTDQNGRTTGAG